MDLPDNLSGQKTVFGHSDMTVKKLLNKHHQLVHSENMKVVSHVQRGIDDWILNTIMVEGYAVPFKYKRKKKYKNIEGQHVNLTYYPAAESVAGFDMEIMKVVRIKIA
jgi:hypothetical protein